jgi:macrolide-specific efflux system membrane fusion protein
VADINTVECIIKISECDVDSLKIGMPILLNVFNNDNKYNATLESIDFVPSSFSDNKDNKVEKQEGSVYYYGHFTLPNENRLLRIGMTTTNTIQLASADNVLVVPINTLQQDEDKIYVKVLENGEVVNHDVVVGIKNALEAEIQSGVNENDKVIVN